MISDDPWGGDQEGNGTAGCALSLNIGPQGLMVLMDQEPAIDQAMRISIPSPILGVIVPTMTDIRWVRTVPLTHSGVRPVFFVGLRFIV
jgi:hypothetical protein